MIVKPHESNYKMVKSGKKINEKNSIKKSWQGDEHIKCHPEWYPTLCGRRQQLLQFNINLYILKYQIPLGFIARRVYFLEIFK
jgi:glutamate formiminotransferase